MELEPTKADKSQKQLTPFGRACVIEQQVKALTDKIIQQGKALQKIEKLTKINRKARVVEEDDIYDLDGDDLQEFCIGSMRLEAEINVIANKAGEGAE